MPPQLSAPGVYVVEVPSGVRAITGVATSIAAFVGRARRGPVDAPVLLHSYADFQRQYGGLWTESTLGYAVRDFYRNGGRDAVILRLFKQGPGGAGAARFIVEGTVKLVASSAGTWGANLRITLDRENIPADQPDRFNLTVTDLSPGTGGAERILGVSLKAASPRRIDLVLERESALVRWDGPPPASDAAPPASGSDPVTAAGVAAKQDELTDKQRAHATAKKALDKGTKELDPADPALEALKAAEKAASEAVVTAETALDAARTAAADALADLGADDGSVLTATEFTAPTTGPGLAGLDREDLFNLLCIPPHVPGGDIEPALVADAAAYCESRRAMLVVDPPASWGSAADAVDGYQATPDDIGTRSRNAALYFPRLWQRDPERAGALQRFAPCGAVAGVCARTDAQRGVWKAPAGIDAAIVGAADLTVNLSDAENGDLNQLGINALRFFPAAGRVVWGARTLQGADRLASEWKYVPVRRTALFLEESLFRGTQWVVFEPNDEPLWAQIRLSVGAFMNSLFRQGAFKGTSPRDAYFVKCDGETTTQNDIDLGIVNIVVGFAPLKPAEFVVISFQQKTGPVQT